MLFKIIMMPWPKDSQQTLPVNTVCILLEANFSFAPANHRKRITCIYDSVLIVGECEINQLEDIGYLHHLQFSQITVSSKNSHRAGMELLLVILLHNLMLTGYFSSGEIFVNVYTKF